MKVAARNCETTLQYLIRNEAKQRRGRIFLVAILYSSRETLHKTLFIKFVDCSQLKENNLA